MKGFVIFLLVCAALVVGFFVGEATHRGAAADERWLEKNVTYEVVSSTEVGDGTARRYLLVLRTHDGETRFYRLRENPPKSFYIERQGDIVRFVSDKANSSDPSPH